LLIEQAATQYNLRLNMAFEVDGIDLTRELVACGFGYGFMTHAAATQNRGPRRLKSVRLIAPQLSSELSLVHMAHAPLTPMHSQAIAILRRTFAELVKEGVWAGGDAVRL
jgi:LysR family nitrogen assimilation transcriptional regulator